MVCDHRVEALDALPPSRVVLADVTPRQLVTIAGERLPPRYRRRLERFRYGPGVFKVDYALSAPVPWADPAVTGAGTVHVGGTMAEVAAAEAAVGRGEHPERPFVLVAQQSLFDPTRAPAGRHTLWTYCHVPAGSTVDMTERIEAQIERFAPGFRDVVIARHVMAPAAIEAHNANYHGGDITAGVVRLAPVRRPSCAVSAALEDPGRRPLPLLRLDPARRRRPRHVRPPRRPPGPQTVLTTRQAGFAHLTLPRTVSGALATATAPRGGPRGSLHGPCAGRRNRPPVPSSRAWPRRAGGSRSRRPLRRGSSAGSR